MSLKRLIFFAFGPRPQDVIACHAPIKPLYDLGASRFGVSANKCSPAIEKYFQFVPCHVNSRLDSRGVPVACETDIYGALSEYQVTALKEKIEKNMLMPIDIITRENVAYYLKS